MRTIALLSLMGMLISSVCLGDVWPEYRGPSHDGMSDATALPLTWSETENVVWKTPINGRGWSSPVVWGSQIWITTAPEDGTELSAVCVSYETGEVLHQVKIFHNENPSRVNALNSYASCSPVIEEGRVYVHFGTFGTACLDTDTGEVLWKRRDLLCDHGEGPGSSPILHGKQLIIPMDGEDVQFLVALDKETGETVWKQDRSTTFPPENDYRGAFSTPLIFEADGKKQMVSTGSKAVWSYDPDTGKELWEVRYAGWSNSPRPIVADGTVIINTGFEEPEFWAVRTNGSGNVTDSHVVWKAKKRVPTIPSPLLIDGLLYFTADKSYVTCLDAKTGEVAWQERIGGTFLASPVSALGRLYFFDDKGRTTVLKAGREFEKLAFNTLDDGFMASPAIVGSSLILRTKTHLYRIEE